MASSSIDLPYRYAWDRCGRKDQPCKVTARGRMNSVCVVFADGFSMVTSRNALRTVKCDKVATHRGADNE